MTLTDLEKIKTTLTKDFDNFWNFEIFKEELVHTNSYYLVLYYQDHILGFAGFKKILEEADLMNIVIAKAYRGPPALPSFPYRPKTSPKSAYGRLSPKRLKE